MLSFAFCFAMCLQHLGVSQWNRQIVPAFLETVDASDSNMPHIIILCAHFAPVLCAAAPPEAGQELGVKSQ